MDSEDRTTCLVRNILFTIYDCLAEKKLIAQIQFHASLLPTLSLLFQLCPEFTPIMP